MVILTYEEIELLMYALKQHDGVDSFLYRKLIRIRATMEANDIRSIDLLTNPDYKQPNEEDNQ